MAQNQFILGLGEAVYLRTISHSLSDHKKNLSMKRQTQDISEKYQRHGQLYLCKASIKQCQETTDDARGAGVQSLSGKAPDTEA